MRCLAPRLLATAVAASAVLSCGEVPTAADGIAYISAIVLPSLNVAAGDTLRDSLGVVAPMQVIAYDANGAVVPGVAVTWFVSPIDTGVHISAAGVLTASDSVRTAHLVARVGDRLQTMEALLYVVPRPDQIVGAGTTDSLSGTPAKRALQVTVTGTRGSARAPAQGVVVRYQIVAVNGSGTFDSTRVFLVDDAGSPLRNALTAAVDSTDASGVASRFLAVGDTTGVRTVEVRAAARPLHGETIAGNPVSFVIPLKKGP